MCNSPHHYYAMIFSNAFTTVTNATATEFDSREQFTSDWRLKLHHNSMLLLEFIDWGHCKLVTQKTVQDWGELSPGGGDNLTASSGPV